MFSNCDMEDLWAVFTEAVGGQFNVSHIMTSWLTQKGFPVVHVTKTVDETKNHISYDFKQDYFLLQTPQEGKPE
jgi:aminopeptidase N